MSGSCPQRSKGGGVRQEMERPIIDNTDEFKRMCLPIISYLEKYCDPYTEVHISMDEIKVTSTECGIPVRVKDD